MGFFSDFGSDIIGGAFGVADTALNSFFNRKAASKQNAYQWDFWHANNDYNSPKSQMQRLEEAGLNPNLVYGNGAATHQATMATAPKVTPTQSNILGAMQTFNQMANTEAQTNNLKVQNKSITLQNKYQSMLNEKYEKDLEVYKKFGVWPSDAGPLGQLLLRYGSSFVRGTGFNLDAFFEGVGKYTREVYDHYAEGLRHIR